MRAVEQRRIALRKANEMRIARARIKRELRRGERTALDVLSSDACAGMAIQSLLLAQKGLGPWRVNRVLSALDRSGTPISPLRACGDLTRRQVKALENALTGGERDA